MESEERSEPEYARAILEGLIRQRRALRRDGGDRGLLEANLLGIRYWQRKVARADAPRPDRRVSGPERGI